MNILVAKRDLISMTSNELDTLYKFYNIPDASKNDRLWLLAIAIHAQNRGQMNSDDLLNAVETGNLELVKELIASGADIDHQDSLGITPLMRASEGHLAIVKELINAGADINHQDSRGFSALMMASADRNLEIVKELLESGADIDNQDNNGITALIIASYNAQLEIVKELINAGSDIERQENRGMTALMFATLERQSEIIKELIKAGANVNHKNNFGHSILDLAKKGGSQEIIDILKEAAKTYVSKDSEWYKVCTDKTDPITLESWQEMTRAGEISDPITIKFPNRVECGERDDIQKQIDDGTKFKIWIPNPDAATNRWLEGEDLIDYSGRGGMLAPGDNGVFVKLGYFYVLVDDEPFDNNVNSYLAELINEKPIKIGAIGSSTLDVSAAHGNAEALVYKIIPADL